MRPARERRLARERGAVEAHGAACTRCSPSTTAPVVVLPDPDSPTRPRVSPWSTSNETPAIACTLRLPPNPLRNSTKTSSSSTRGSLGGHAAPPSPARSWFGQIVDADAEKVPMRRQARGRCGDTRRSRTRTASRRRTRRMRRAAPVGRPRSRRVARPADTCGIGTSERSRIGVYWCFEHVVRRPALDDATRVHHGDVVAPACDARQIVAQPDDGRAADARVRT